MALQCTVFEMQPNWGHGSPPPCPSVIICTRDKQVGNAAALEWIRLLSYVWFCWSGDVPNATAMAIYSEQPSILLHCSGFLHWGQTRAPTRVTSALEEQRWGIATLHPEPEGTAQPFLGLQ